MLEMPKENERRLIHTLDCLRKFLYVMLPAKPCPFDNIGPGNDIKTDVVEICAYKWNDEDQEYNFKYGDFEVSWYKYLGRDTWATKELNDLELQEMLIACIASLGKDAVMEALKENAERMISQHTPYKPGEVIYGYCNAPSGQFVCGRKDKKFGDRVVCTYGQPCMWKEIRYVPQRADGR